MRNANLEGKEKGEIFSFILKVLHFYIDRGARTIYTFIHICSFSFFNTNAQSMNNGHNCELFDCPSLLKKESSPRPFL